MIKLFVLIVGLSAVNHVPGADQATVLFPVTATAGDERHFLKAQLEKNVEVTIPRKSSLSVAGEGTGLYFSNVDILSLDKALRDYDSALSGEPDPKCVAGDFTDCPDLWARITVENGTLEPLQIDKNLKPSRKKSPYVHVFKDSAGNLGQPGKYRHGGSTGLLFSTTVAAQPTLTIDGKPYKPELSNPGKCGDYQAAVGKCYIIRIHYLPAKPTDGQPGQGEKDTHFKFLYALLENPPSADKQLVPEIESVTLTADPQETMDPPGGRCLNTSMP